MMQYRSEANSDMKKNASASNSERNGLMVLCIAIHIYQLERP